MINADALLAEPLTHNWEAPGKAAAGATDPRSAEAVSARALALAQRLPPSVEGHGGDAALFHAACELATVLGEDSAAIAGALTAGFNPRCAPPWPPEKISREAARAAQREGDPARKWGRRREAFAPASGVHGVSGEVDWTAPEEPIEWYCRGLAIAPSERKITLIGGDPGAGKGPLADYLGACFATGAPVFGVYPVRRCNVGLLDFEGLRLTKRRVRSHMRGLGLPIEMLQGSFFARDADPCCVADLGWLREWIDEKRIEVLIIDSYLSAMAEIDADPNSPDYAILARELGKLGIVVIVVAHARKPTKGSRGERPSLGDIAGSFALGGMAATGIAVWKPDEDDPLLTRIGCMRAPEDPFATIEVRWRKSGDDEAPAWAPKLEGEVKNIDADAEERASDETIARHLRAVVKHLRQNIAVPQSANAIANATGVHNRYVGTVCAALARAGWAHHEADASGRSSGKYVLDHECPEAECLTMHGGESVERPRPAPATKLGNFRRPT